MKTNKYVKILLDNGLGVKTISKLNESQMKVLAEKFEKEESKEQVQQKQTTSTVVGPKGGVVPTKPGQTQVSLKPVANAAPGTMEVVESDDTVDFVMDPAATEDGMPTTEGEMNEKFKSTAQQKFFWNKCTKSGDKKSRWCKWANEFQKDTKDKNLPEKLHPEKTVKVRKENYERFLEDSIVEMVDKYINPGMTKSQLINRITEKVNKSESFMLKRPKKNTMFSKEEGNEMKTMKRPIGRMSSLGEDTKEKERTKTKEKEKDKERKNPFAPKYNPKPKAKKEFKEQEIAPSKPGTKEKTREKEPGKKNPFAPKYNPAPKAGKGNMPNWLVWNKLGVNLK
jgi:hypothetical protein